MSTTETTTAYVPEVGDVVIVPDSYCRGCDREITDRRGIVVGRVEGFSDIALFHDDGPHYAVRIGRDIHATVLAAAALRKVAAADEIARAVASITARLIDEYVISEVEDPCAACGNPIRVGVEIHHLPHVCTCSETTRPTEAHPCRETETTRICLKCRRLHLS